MTRNQICKNVIEAIIEAFYRGTKLHHYSNAGVTNTGQEPIIATLHVIHDKSWPSDFVAGRKMKSARIERNFLNFMWTSR